MSGPIPLRSPMTTAPLHQRQQHLPSMILIFYNRSLISGMSLKGLWSLPAVTFILVTPLRTCSGVTKQAAGLTSPIIWLPVPSTPWNGPCLRPLPSGPSDSLLLEMGAYTIAENSILLPLSPNHRVLQRITSLSCPSPLLP